MWISFHLSCDFILNLPLFLTQTNIHILCTTRFCTVTWIVPLGVLSGTHPVEFGHNVKKPVVAVMGFFVFFITYLCIESAAHLAVENVICPITKVTNGLYKSIKTSLSR